MGSPLRLLGALVLGAALCACTKAETGAVSPAGGEANAGWTRPGVLRFAENADPKSLNPVLASSAVVGDLSMFIYSYTIRYDDNSRPVPDALREIPTVENGDVSKDGLTLKYKLRPNMKWQDGAAVSCADLRFTWQAVMNPHNNSNTTDGYRDIKAIDCSDPLVAVVHMKRVYAPFLQQLWSINGNAPILPEHLLAKYNDERGSFNTAPYNALPVGSGPFKVVEWQRGSQVRMVANPDFYLGPPKLKEVIFKIMPDANTALTQLKTHEIDMIVHGSLGLWQQFQKIPGVVAQDPAIFTYDHVDFNLKRPLFQDVRVRRALDYATDRGGMLAKLAHGLGDLAPADQSPRLSWAYSGDVAKYPYDPEKAKALLEAAGWRAGPDGIRVKDGTRLAFALSTQTESTLGKAIQQYLQDSWHAIGADVTIKNAETALFFENSASGILQGGRYDVAIFAWSAAADPDDSPIYSGDNLAPKGQNAIFWTDAQATAAMNDALKTVDVARRKADYKIVQQRIADQVPTIVLWFRHEPTVYNKDLKGFTASPAISTFWNTWEFSI